MELLQQPAETRNSGQEASAYAVKHQYYKDPPGQISYEVEAGHGLVEVDGRREVAEASGESLIGELPAETRRQI